MVDGQRDGEGSKYSLKAIIRCGLALNVNGLREVRQLFPHFQEIVKKYPENLNGESVSQSMALDGEVTETDSDT